MKINGTLQSNIANVSKQKKYNSNPFLNNSKLSDSVSFSGKYEKKTSFPKRLSTRIGAGLMAVAAFFSASGKNVVSATETNEIPQTNATSNQGTIVIRPNNNSEIFSAQNQSIDKLEENNIFQLAQTKDSPSLTFDFTNNYQPCEFEPIASSVVLTQNPDKNKIEEFSNLKTVIEEVYGVKADDVEKSWLIAQSIVKANPWMAEMVTAGAVDYTQGDITNIDPEMILSTDYAAGLNEGKRINLPTVNVLVEKKDDDTALTFSTEFLPFGANKDGKTTIILTKDDFASAWLERGKINILDSMLADAYEIPTFNSYAGIGIWHGIALDEANYEIFEGASEEDTKSALLNYIQENGSVVLTLPRVGITAMNDADSKTTMAQLLANRNSNVTISYLTPDRSVYDLSEMSDKVVRPIDILDTIHFVDGTSLKEAYESDPQRYKGIVLAAFRQQIDNNNALLEVFGSDVIDIDDLYAQLDLNNMDAKDAKINLQPVAFAHPEMIRTAPPKGTEPTDPSTEPTTEPTDPSTEPTDPSTEPTDPSTEPTDPSTEPTECPDLPDINPDDETLPDEKPTLPTRPEETRPSTEPTEPSTEPTEPSTEPTEPPFCPTEPSQPDTDDLENDANDDMFDFVDEDETTLPTETESQETTTPTESIPEVTTPETTQPSTEATEPNTEETEPSDCPELPEIPGIENDNELNDDMFDFEDEDVPTPEVTQAPLPSETETPAPVETECPPIGSDDSSSDNSNDLNDNIFDFE